MSESAESLFKQANDHARRREYDHSIPLLEKAVELEPDNYKYRLFLACYLMFDENQDDRKESHKRAIQELTICLQLLPTPPDEYSDDPRVAQVYQYRGYANKFLEHYIEAVSDLRIATKHYDYDADDEEAYKCFYSLALCYEKIQDYSSAHWAYSWCHSLGIGTQKTAAKKNMRRMKKKMK